MTETGKAESIADIVKVLRDEVEKIGLNINEKGVRLNGIRKTLIYTAEIFWESDYERQTYALGKDETAKSKRSRFYEWIDTALTNTFNSFNNMVFFQEINPKPYESYDLSFFEEEKELFSPEYERGLEFNDSEPGTVPDYGKKYHDLIKLNLNEFALCADRRKEYESFFIQKLMIKTKPSPFKEGLKHELEELAKIGLDVENPKVAEYEFKERKAGE